VCRKLGWEYTKAHLDLFQHIAGGIQEAMSRQAVRRAMREEERWREQMERQQGPEKKTKLFSRTTQMV